ncbi:cation:proton antiporter domain-containing protein [Aurantiacibacter poecillastricola]|uniref:cation:proton antiporter domain-containing protein n=1 Tax=Aurantiacibacter poecillastricola TaxID=3064385 RepID=UPI00273EDD8D|nr:cation:proton antiporter [Aurantiacibacter sp. 219JJ12-13]MDP5262536.1 cation:proton antiporter [Aurantiacibacter sp. 219JJ12-13]
MEALDIPLAVAAGTVLGLTLVSGWIKSHLWASEALICLLIGMALGEHGAGLLQIAPSANENHLAFVEQFTRLTLALSVMSAALSLPTGYVRDNWRSLALILLPGTALMWFASTGIAMLFLGLPLMLALLAGAIVTPTDPVLARSIISGRLAEECVPARTRNIITAESGINDGLALPLVLFPLLLMDQTKDAFSGSFAFLAWEVVGALVLGWILGKATGWVFKLGREREFAETKSLTATTFALALLALAGISLLGADGILAVFVSGLVLNCAMKEEGQESHEHFQDAVDRSLTLPVFILLGLIAPVAAWIEMGWPLVGAALAIVLLRRLPLFMLLQLLGKPYANYKEAVFAGWFGPIGVAALFYAAFAARHGASDILWPLISLTVVLSVIAFGVSGTPLTKAYGKRQSL